MVWPKENLFHKEKVAIGEKLFFDPILSVNNKISCSTCHLPSLAFTDGKRVSKGLFSLSRSAPSLLNIGFHSKGLFWDGSASTLEKQALMFMLKHLKIYTVIFLLIL
jgi:cytochrome c peroxidase